MFYCAHDYYSLFSMPLTLIYQLKSDRCPAEQKAQACTAKQNLKSLSHQILLLIIHLYTSFYTHSLHKLLRFSLCNSNLLLHTFSNTFLHKLWSNGHYSVYLCRCEICTKQPRSHSWHHWCSKGLSSHPAILGTECPGHCPYSSCQTLWKPNHQFLEDGSIW